MIRYSIDSIRIENEKAMISGWAVMSVPENTILYDVIDKDGKTVPFELLRGSRSDIAYGFFNDASIRDLGFFLTVRIRKNENYRLMIRERDTRSGRVITEVAVPVGVNALKGRGALKTVKREITSVCKKAKNFAGRAIHIQDRRYRKWFSLHRVSEEELLLQGERFFENGPKFSILTPVYHTDPRVLRETIASVLSQSYRNFELILIQADEADTERTEICKHYALQDPRVIVKVLKENGGIARNTNEGLKIASGDYLCMLDHDDTITPDALYRYAERITKEPETGLLYSDEDKLADPSGKLYFPYFKPDFSPELLYANNYMCHFLCVKKEIADQIGGWDPETDGAQDYDFILKAAGIAKKIYHEPRILYHWRSSQTSTAKSHGNKSYAVSAGRKALENAYRRKGISAEVIPAEIEGWYRTRFLLKETPLVSVLIPNRDHTDDLDRCLRSLYEKCDYRNFEVIVIENNSTEPETFSYYEEAKKKYDRLRVLFYPSEFNYSAINNFGEKEANGDYLLLLNNDIEVISEDLFESMLGYVMNPDIGIAGIKLLYPDDTIQHAGVLLGPGGQAIHVLKNIPDEDPGYLARAVTVSNVSAVTAACLMVSREDYEKVGGFDENFRVAFNDIDFCMKIRALGKRIVYDADAKAYHFESKSRGAEDTPEKYRRQNEEVRRLAEKWQLLSFTSKECDPYYNPNLSYLDLYHVK